jgi:hypothetical protein
MPDAPMPIRPARTHTSRTGRPQQSAREAATETEAATATNSATATDPPTETNRTAETKRSKRPSASDRHASAAVNRRHAETPGRQLEPLQIKAGAEEFLAARSQESARFGEDRTRAMSRASAELPHASKKRGEWRGARARVPFRVRPAWALTGRCESSRKLVVTIEVNCRASNVRTA